MYELPFKSFKISVELCAFVSLGENPRLIDDFNPVVIVNGTAKLIAYALSAIDADGQPFHDPAADLALFDELDSRVEQTASRQIKRLPLHINDLEFANALVSEFQRLWSGRRIQPPPSTRSPS